MQKTNKSLLIKVLTVLCALCFTLVLAFGLVGCAKEQVAIVGSDLVNGKLVLTYSDGSTKEYEIGKDGEDGVDGEDYVGLTEKCTDGAAHDLSSIVVKYANCKEKGIQLVVCSTCKGFKAVETEKNPELHGTYVTELQQAGDLQVPVLKFVSYEVAAGENEEPTCTKEGKRVTECAGCGVALANEVVPALNHKHENGADAYVYVEGEVLDGNYCMDGTFDGYVCVLCNDVKDAVYDEPIGHHTADATWEVIAAPTKDTVGKIAGVCTECHTEQEIELPVLTSNKYTHYVPTCITVATEDQEVYTLTDYYGFSTTFKFDYEVSHKVVVGTEDVEITELATYEYTTLGLTADDFTGGQIPDCKTAKIAKVFCSDCNTFIAVYATGEHKYAAEPDKDAEGNVIKKAATCTETGYNAIYTCTAEGCGNTKVLPSDVTPALGHKLVKNGDYVYDAQDATLVTVPVKCERCDYTGTIAGQITASGVASCQSKAYKTIKYTIEQQEVIETIYEGELAPHNVIVGGQTVDIFELGTYTYVELGLTAADFSGGQIPDCKTAKVAKVFCAECNTFIAVYATGEHKFNAEPDKDAEGNTVKLAPTCTEDGYNAIYTCTAEGCGHYVILPSDVVPATGHDWTAEVVDGTVKLTCANCDVVASGIIDSIDDTTYPASCGVAGKVIYYYYETEADKTAGVNLKSEEVDVPALNHDFTDAHEIEFEMTIGGKDYVCKAKLCNNCDIYFIYEKTLKA